MLACELGAPESARGEGSAHGARGGQEGKEMRGSARVGRLVAVLGILGGLMLGMAALSWADIDPVPTRKQLVIRTSVAGVNALGYVDSFTVSINGAIGTTGTIDTTVAIDTFADGWDWAWLQRAGGATAIGAGRLAVTGTNTASDTIFYQVMTSPDNVNWSTSSTFIGGLIGTSGDASLSGPFLCDTDVLGTGGTGTIFLSRYVRFIFRADGNTGSKILNARLYLTYLKRAAAQ